MSELRTIAVDLVPVLPGGDNGGAKIFTIELVRMLAKLHPTIRFVLFTQAGSHEELASLDGPNVSRMLVWGGPTGPSPAGWLTKAGKAALAMVPRAVADRVQRGIRRFRAQSSGPSLPRQVGADLLFCPLTAPLFFDPEIPAVCVVYDLQYKSYPQFFSSAETSQRERTFHDACRKASAIGVISDYVRKSVIEAKLIAPERVFTTYIRLPHRLPSLDASQVGDTLTRLDIKSGEYVFYPANFWRHKNHEILVTGFLMARARGLPEHLKLVFTGAPSERMDELARAAAALGLQDRVVFAGFVAETEFAVLLKNCLAVVFPSLYEGFGMPVIEAMAAGCPVTCSNRTSLPEVAGDAALQFDPRIPTQVADALVRIATDEPLRASLIERGKRQAEVFGDSTQMAREYWRCSNMRWWTSGARSRCKASTKTAGADRRSCSATRTSGPSVSSILSCMPPNGCRSRTSRRW
jgi:glycosyltransferase involved in cell wall biosynthesis